MIVVGVDGASPETLVAPARRGSLEHIGSLLDEGVGGSLWSVTTSSAAAWTAHLTGLEPEDGGITGFTTNDRFVETTDIRVRTYPELLDEAGIRVGLVNIPITYPPLDLEHGFNVPGQLTPLDAEEYANPPELHAILDEVEYEVDVQYGDRQYSFVDADVEASGGDVLEDVLRVERKRTEACRRLMEAYDWDLFVVQINGTDPVQHFLWDEVAEARLEESRVFQVYEVIDEFVGDVRDSHPDEDILMFSDHGFRRDVWGKDEATRRRWGKIRGLGSRLMPDRLKQTRVRGWALDVLAAGASATNSGTDDRHPGAHDPEGAWVLSGPSVEASPEDREAQFLDLPPTILHLLGQPIPARYPGSVLTDSLVDDRTPEMTDRDIGIDRRGQREAIDREEQLAHLGYVEMVEGDE